MHNNRGGVEPRGVQDVRPRSDEIIGTVGRLGRMSRLAMQGITAAALLPRPSMGEPAGLRTSGNNAPQRGSLLGDLSDQA